MQSTLENTKGSEDLFFVAIAINVIGNFIDGIGWCMQKKSHRERLLTSHKNESFVKDTNWWAGFAIHAIGNVLAKISYAFGPASLLLPLDTLRIAFTTALASKYLDEKVATKEIIGISIIIASAILSTLFGPRPIQTYYTIEDIEYRYSRKEFLIVAGLISGIALADYILLKLADKYFSDVEFFQQDRFYMVSYVGIAAFFGAWNVLLVKCVLEVLSSSFISSEIAKLNWTHWLAYVNIIALVTTTINIEYWRQKALIKYHTGYVVAIFTILQIVGGILLSSIFFEEFILMKWYELLLFFTGIILSFVGVSVVVYDDEHHKMVQEQKTQNKLDLTKVALEPVNTDNISMDHSSSENEGQHGNVVTIAEKKQLMDHHL